MLRFKYKIHSLTSRKYDLNHIGIFKLAHNAVKFELSECLKSNPDICASKSNALSSAGNGRFYFSINQRYYFLN